MNGMLNGHAKLNGHGRNGHAKLPQGTLLDSTGKPMRVNAYALGSGYPYPWGGTGYANYGASQRNNAMVGWLWHGGDADRDIGWNIQILRERSRDAFMGIPLAAGAIETLDTNVIGEGLVPAPNVDGKALGLNEEQTATLNQELFDKFNWWATDPRESDFESKHTFYMLQHIAFQSMLLSGDCPVLFPLVPKPGTMFDFRLRILEADRIRNPPYFSAPPGGAPFLNIFTGVEVGEDGELLAYHITERHPLAAFYWTAPLPVPIGKTFRIEPYGALTGRRNMILLIKPERPEQRRGVPILSVCLELLKQMGRFTDSTVLGAVIQSYFCAFITSEFPDPTIFDNLLTEEQKEEVLSINPYNVQLGPGIVNFMRPGHKVDFSKPTQPIANFGEFSIAVAKFIGAAIGVPYEVLLKQYNASYSASRAALLDFWKRVRKWRAIIADQMCQPVYEEWLNDAIALERIDNFKGNWDDPLIKRAMLRCIWTGSSQGSLDPQKEVIAADTRVKCGFSTIEREAQELNGSNWRDNVRQQSVEQKEFNKADLLFPVYRPTQITTKAQEEAGVPPPPPKQPEPGKPPGSPKEAPPAAPPKFYKKLPTPAPRKTIKSVKLGARRIKGVKLAGASRA